MRFIEKDAKQQKSLQFHTFLSWRVYILSFQYLSELFMKLQTISMQLVIQF